VYYYLQTYGRIYALPFLKCIRRILYCRAFLICIWAQCLVVKQTNKRTTQSEEKKVCLGTSVAIVLGMHDPSPCTMLQSLQKDVAEYRLFSFVTGDDLKGRP
jgi:hypothetical protein